MTDSSKPAEAMTAGVDLGVVVLEPISLDEADTPVEKASGGKKPGPKKSPPPPSSKIVVSQDEEMPPLGVFRLSPHVEYPRYATQGSGRFDLQVYLGEEIDEVNGFNKNNEPIRRSVRSDENGRYVMIACGDRLLLPSGLIFDIPEGYGLDIIPRSSTGYSRGLNLANTVGFIDSDYVQETMIPIESRVETRLRIRHGDRLVQVRMIRTPQVEFVTLTSPPGQKSSRSGGFGSTGK